MSLIQVGLLESIFHTASLLFEVPSGTLADHFAYKTVLVMGRLMAILSGILFLSGTGFWWFALAFIIQAFSYNLNSGTNEALVFETLKADHLEKHYLKITANLNAIYELADMLGLIVAGFRPLAFFINLCNLYLHIIFSNWRHFTHARTILPNQRRNRSGN